MNHLFFLGFILLIFSFSGCSSTSQPKPFKDLKPLPLHKEKSLTELEKDLESQIKEKPKLKEGLSVEIFSGKSGLDNINPMSFNILENEIKKVCLNTETGKSLCFYVGYFNKTLYWNVPSKKKESYIEEDFDEEQYKDRDTFKLSFQSALNGSFEEVFMIPQKRGYALDLSIFIQEEGK